jgi:flagellar protein FliO/FliZ
VDTFFQGLLFVIVFGSLLFLAVIATRFIGGRAKQSMKGKYISIVDTVSLGGMDKKLHLIKVGSEFVLVSVSMKSIEYLTTVKIDDFDTNDTHQDNNDFDFKKYFDNYFKLIKIGTPKKNPERDTQTEQIQRRSIKNNLDRIRNMTSAMDKIDVLDGDENTNEKK